MKYYHIFIDNANFAVYNIGYPNSREFGDAIKLPCKKTKKEYQTWKA